MAHFAQLNNSSTVVQVIVISNAELVTDIGGTESEAKGIAFCQSLYGVDTIWKQTSYNGTIRKNFAGLGFTYDATRDAFIPPKPFASWVLDEGTCQWKAPVPYPSDGSLYRWDEDSRSWVKVSK